ncbi:MAG: TatD family hydrolase [Gammaproteobacteria bacterium]|nr:TatD family hydrolase [Gammaproteobacteria bacterium]
MLIDSHCHLDRVKLAPFADNFETMLQTAKENQVDAFLNVCIDLEHFEDVFQPTQNHDNIWCSVGVHPTEKEGQEPDVETLVQLAKRDKVIAIGETGIDYHWENENMEWQRERFRVHIRAARQCGKPLIIHSRSAREDTLKIFAEEGGPEVGGVMHCFAEDLPTANKAMKLGLYISFSGIVTFKSATEIQETAQNIPLDRLLIETDSPYLAPVPHRGKANHPALVKHVAEKVAELRGISFEEVAKASSDNFRRLFKVESLM